jgi:hypothetical protein
LLWAEIRSFRVIRPADSRANHGISARIGRKSTVYPRGAKIWLKILPFVFNILTRKTGVQADGRNISGLVQTAATIGGPYMGIPNGKGVLPVRSGWKNEYLEHL